MFEREKVEVIFLKSIGGLAEPRYGLATAFSYLLGDRVSLHPKLAELWIQAGIAKPAGEVTIEELIDLKIAAAK